MRLLLPVLAVIVALLSPCASAKVVSFPKDNFSLDTPEGWAIPPLPAMPPQCRLITAARSPANGHFYDVMTMDLPLHGSPEAFLTGMRKPLIAKGWKASPIRDATIDGKPFAVFTMSRETGPPFMLMATTFADDHVYVVQVGTPNGNVEEMADLNAIVQSFHFLQPVHSVSQHELTTGTQAYQIGYFIGHGLRSIGQYLAHGKGPVIILGLVIFLIILAIRFAR